MAQVVQSAVLSSFVTLLVVATGTLLVIGPPELAFVPVLGILGLTLRPMVRALDMRDIMFAVAALVVVGDANFPGYTAATEFLGEALFSKLIPGFLTMFELCTMGLFAWTLVKGLGSRGDPAMGSEAFRVLFFVTALLAVSAVLSTFVGYFTCRDGFCGELRIVYWQARGFPFILAWSVIGYAACRSPKDALRFLDVFTVVVALTCVQYLYVFVVGHGGTLGDLEYLTSHVGSLYMGIALVRLGVLFFYESRGARRWLVLAAFLLVGTMWIVNERRISYLGVVFTVVFCAPFILRYVTRKHVAFAAGAAAILAVYFALSWSSGNFLKDFLVKNPYAPVDYRDTENYNLFVAIGTDPVLGRGYGAAFKQYIVLPNIFDISEVLSWIPHNNLLMIWANAGPLGIAALGLAITFTLAALVRLFTRGVERETRIFAFVGFSVIVQWTLFIWADMAFSWCGSLMLPGVVAGFAFKLLHLRRVTC